MRRTTASTSSSACGAVVDMVWMNAALVAVVWLAGPAMSQYQSFYAGGGWSYPGPLPQFADNSDSLDSRAGQATTTTQSPDQAMASHVANWPEDRQPFWFVNREQMEQHIGRPQSKGSPQGQGGTQGQPQNQPGAQPGGADTQQNQQPQDLPSTRSQLPGRPQIGSQPEDDESQEDMRRLFLSWLRNQSSNPRRQQWLQESPPDTQTQDTQEPRWWRGRPGTKTISRPQ